MDSVDCRVYGKVAAQGLTPCSPLYACAPNCRNRRGTRPISSSSQCFVSGGALVTERTVPGTGLLYVSGNRKATAENPRQWLVFGRGRLQSPSLSGFTLLVEPS